MVEILEPSRQLAPQDVERELQALAERYRRAGRSGVKVANLLGAQAENLLDRLPGPVRDGLGRATEQGLTLAVEAAGHSRRAVPDQPVWVNTAMSSVMGAAGGFSGLPGTLVELPMTITLLMRAVQGVAVQHGFDPSADSVKFDCVRVFSSGGPLSHDDADDLAFIAIRVSLGGAAMQKMIATIAPRLAAVLGQKLAAQSIPVLGAVTGAAVNYVYTDYYQQLADVHFGLRRLAIDADRSHEELVEGLRLYLQA
jgi:hypothetical protein